MKITDITHRRRRNQIVPRVPAPSPDDVVSRLSFGFWPNRESRPRRGLPQTVQAPAPSTPAEALIRLRLLYDRVIELLAWLSPDIAAQHALSDMHLRCLYLLQSKALNAYQQALPPAEVNLAALGNLRTLRKTLRYAARHPQPIVLKDGRRLIGHLSCAVH